MGVQGWEGVSSLHTPAKPYTFTTTFILMSPANKYAMTISRFPVSQSLNTGTTQYLTFTHIFIITPWWSEVLPLAVIISACSPLCGNRLKPFLQYLSNATPQTPIDSHSQNPHAYISPLFWLSTILFHGFSRELNAYVHIASYQSWICSLFL